MQGLSEGSALLGKQVSFAGDSGNTETGTVESVFVSESGDVKLKLEGGKEIDLREVLGISQAATPATSTTPPATPGSETQSETQTNTATS